jgi:CheY-like chemotaxis protein
MGLLTKLVLERAGHYVEHVGDGREAWQRVMTNPLFFDLVITDHQMPHLTGLQLVAQLRRADYAGSVIVLSSSVSMSEEHAFRELGVQAILQKPASADQLLTAVNRVRPR